MHWVWYNIIRVWLIEHNETETYKMCLFEIKVKSHGAHSEERTWLFDSLLEHKIMRFSSSCRLVRTAKLEMAG